MTPPTDYSYDAIMAEMRALIDKNTALQNRVRRLEARLAYARERVRHFRGMLRHEHKIVLYLARHPDGRDIEP